MRIPSAQEAMFYLIDPRAEAGELLGKVVGEALPTLETAVATCATRTQREGRWPMFPRIVEIHYAVDEGRDIRIGDVAQLFNHAGAAMALRPYARQSR